MALLEAGTGCPRAELARGIQQAPGQPRLRLVPHWRVRSARARVRARQALAQARRLYTRTDFAGCIALLSITEQELGGSLAASTPAVQLRAHHLLARVNLWLGICQWAAGDAQNAASAFVRSAQLPSSPAPDPRLLPPAVVKAYRLAVTAPREQVTCQVEAPLTPGSVEVNGRGPVVMGRAILVPAGTHYLVLSAPGTADKLSLRLAAAAPRCAVQLSADANRARPVCVSLAEARDPAFVARITDEVNVAGTLLVSLARARLELRLHRKGGAAFERQFMVRLGQGERPHQVVTRSMHLLFPPPAPRPTSGQPRWYTKWWVWALAGVAVAVTTTAVVVATQNDRSTVVFGP